MKNSLIRNTARAIAAAFVLTAASAFAGPGAPMLYVPVTAGSPIAPTSHLAATCGKCHAVFSVTKGYEKSVTCPGCKAKFVRKDIGGRGASVASYVYVDEGGHEATLLKSM